MTRIGLSGWSYKGWKGPFYPPDVSQKRQLAYASRQVTSLEINGSFYSLLTPEAYRRYYEETPEGFVFAVKGGQFITHSKKLKDVRAPLANFFASGVLRLEEKLGPVLWQFPQLAFDHDRVAAFLDLLPYDTAAAARLARRHDERVAGRAHTRTGATRRIRHAFEFRHPDMLTADIVRMLRAHGVALVFSHSGDWPYLEEVTAGFVYMRLHGAPRTYLSLYGDQLGHWADRIRLWASGTEPPDARRITDRPPPRRKTRDVYVYFDNDQQAHAPQDARALMQILDRPAS